MTLSRIISPILVAALPLAAAAQGAQVSTMGSGDWTGYYGGLSVGGGQADVDSVTGRRGGGGASRDEDYDGLGVHIGYMYDLGNIVLGGEFEYRNLSYDNGTRGAGSSRVKVRAGYDAGQFQPYGFVGISDASVEGFSENMTIYGIGIDYLFGNNVMLGAEFLVEESGSQFGSSGFSLDNEEFSIRIGYKF